MKPTPWPYSDVHKECFKVLGHLERFMWGYLLVTLKTSVIKKGQDVDSVVQSGHNLCSDMFMALKDGCQSKRDVRVKGLLLCLTHTRRSLSRTVNDH